MMDDDSATTPWVRLGHETVYDGYTTVRRDTYRLPDGSVSDWDVLVQGDTVAVIAVTDSGRALLFEQFRVGPRMPVRELPGGLIDPGEDPVTAAARELREETGHRAAALFHAGSEWSGANSTRRKHVVIAAGCRRVGEPRWETGETGSVLTVTLDALIAHLLSGDLSDAGEAVRGLQVFLRSDLDDPTLRDLQGVVGSAWTGRDGAAVGAATAAATAADPAAAEDDLDRFWEHVDLERPDRARADLAAILAARGQDDARASYERASLHDSLGEEREAIPLYRDALGRGLAGPHRTRAVIQLASSLRNVGESSAAIALLRGVADDDPLIDAARAFLSLALFSDEKPARALTTALTTLAPRLPRYQRAVRAYAGELSAPDRVRAIAVGLVVHDGRVLLESYPANDRHGEFLRAPGGGIAFGEPAAVALAREFAEELDAALDDVEPLGVTENIFDGPAGRGHEIVHVFRVRSHTLSALPVDGRIAVGDSHTSVGWYDIAAATRDTTRPVYPVGILDLLG